MYFLDEMVSTGVSKVPYFLEGSSFRDVVECWKNIFKKS
jgi:hypothetical protein